MYYEDNTNTHAMIYYLVPLAYTDAENFINLPKIGDFLIRFEIAWQ
jgi:hypothetical protein